MGNLVNNVGNFGNKMVNNLGNTANNLAGGLGNLTSFLSGDFLIYIVIIGGIILAAWLYKTLK